MHHKIVLLSGPVCAGKSTLAKLLAQRYGTIHIRTQDFLRAIDSTVENSRDALQELGEKLDRKTKGAWVRDSLVTSMGTDGLTVTRVLDAVRIASQVNAIRQSYGRRVIHIHLTAPLEELTKRYRSRTTSAMKELGSYKRVRENLTEAAVEELAEIADIVIDSKRCREEDVLVRAASHIGLYGREYARNVDVLVGGQYGSEGKGQVAAYLASEYDLLIRVGGPNAGHKVFHEPEPRTFHHLPSGTLSCSAKLVLGPGAVLNPDSLLKEIASCGIDCERLSIDPNAMIITSDDIEAEERLKKTIGSTGQGVGSATARKIMGRQDSKTLLARNVPELKPFLRESCEVLDEAFRNGLRVFLEGTQGTGLSIHHGSYPHVTSRDTTVAGCLAEAGISPSRVRKVVMVCRTYPIRVQSPDEDGQTSGWMSQEIDWSDVAKRAGLDVTKLREAEKTSTTKRKRRVGEFDWKLLRKSASLNAPTDIALTFVDYLNASNSKAKRFEQLDAETIVFIEEIQRIAGAPVSLISTCFDSRPIIDRRSW